MKQGIYKSLNLLIVALASPLLLHASPSADNNKTRGIGIYPGRPSECYIPVMTPAGNAYRNVAQNRNAMASSSYDYNLTPHLVTDGIVSGSDMSMLTVTTPSGTLAKDVRENLFDGNMYSRVLLQGNAPFIEFNWGDYMCDADSIWVFGSCAYREGGQKSYKMTYTTMLNTGKNVIKGGIGGDGLVGEKRKYKEPLDPDKQTEQEMLPVCDIERGLKISNVKPFNRLRLDMTMDGAVRWEIKELMFFRHGERVVDMLPSYRFSSAWMSAGSGKEWICIDLGTKTTFNKVRINWISKAAEGYVETSDNGTDWSKAGTLKGGKKLLEEIACNASGRYVRIVMTKPMKAGSRYAISEVQVMGNGGLTPQPAREDMATATRLPLNGGAWMLQRSSEVKATGEQISQAAYEPKGWITATVPATVLMSYVNIGAVADPNYDDNANTISESFFNSDFWYRRSFSIADKAEAEHYDLCFDGINWKAEVYVNGKKAGRIDGAFTRGRFDITPMVKSGVNTVAVKIIHNAHYGAIKQKTAFTTGFNGGILGFDNPTFHATIGWDWITTVRGRDMGIWNDVYIQKCGGVTVSDALVTTKIADSDTLATMTPQVVLTNSGTTQMSGVLKGWIGNIQFQKNVTVEAGETQQVTFSPDEFAQLKNQRMNLWWPNGYGTPYLYDAGFAFTTADGHTETMSYKAGIREVSYTGLMTKLQLYVNHRRVVPLGGNWGFPESNLSYRAREYETAVNYHKQMNFNMIRNWVGQTGDEEFYEACDRNGIMVWQDFWLANPVDGPNPKDEKMFLDNAVDYVYRIRNHPSVVLYCGRNEGYPTETINEGLKKITAKLHPTLPYFPSSADDGVSGHGPYRAMTPEYYFTHQTGKLHSERGMPNVMNIENLQRTLTADHLWPQSEFWGRHDYTLKGAQGGESFNELIEKTFWKPQSAEDFTRLAQWENYEGYRAMYESGSKDRQGLLIWMSHPCWPSMVWQTYDYFFEPTAAFFGSKKACEPLHIQLNAADNMVEVVNMAGGEQKNLKATACIYDMNGNMITECTQGVNSSEDTTLKVMAMADDMSKAEGVYFLRLRLDDADGRLVSENFYIRSNDDGKLGALSTLPEAKLDSRVVRTGLSAKVTVSNIGKAPALMIRLDLKDGDGKQILPVCYSDNYFSLLPGESRTIDVTWKSEDVRQGNEQITVSTLLK